MNESDDSERKEARLSELVGRMRETSQDRTPVADAIGFRHARTQLDAAVRAVTELRRRERAVRRSR
jgi:hypothetical protein